MKADVRRLSTEQTEAFDVEYIDKALFLVLTTHIDKQFDTSQPFHLLDVGGGNGMYADKVLEHYPSADVTVVEPEQALLDKNRAHPNKHLQASTFQESSLQTRHDMIQFNWVLHHFVADSFSQTLNAQQNALDTAYQNLNPGGLLIVFENLYEGEWLHDLPGQLIYRCTASKLLTPLSRRMGANTAGVGVSFHSQTKWQQMIEKAGFRTTVYVPCYHFGNLGRLVKFGLHLKEQKVGMFIAIKKR